MKLKEDNGSLLSRMSEQQTILDDQSTETRRLEEELRSDPNKQKALALHDELYQLQKQKLELDEETGQNRLSVPEEIERLTQKVKAANSEISSVEQQTSSTLDSINKVNPIVG